MITDTVDLVGTRVYYMTGRHTFFDYLNAKKPMTPTVK